MTKVPTYEYECGKCQKRFERFQPISEPPVKQCPSCGGPVKRLVSGGSGLIFKGSGFYVTDYKRSKASGEKSGAASPSTSEASTPAKTEKKSNAA